MLFQNGIPSETLIDIIIITTGLVSGIFLLKLGLSLVKAEKKTSMKHVMIYYLIYLGTIMFVMMQMVFIQMSGPDFFIIIPLAVIATFIVTNMINIFHDTGIKKAIVLTIILIVPITIAMTRLGPMLGQLGN